MKNLLITLLIVLFFCGCSQKNYRLIGTEGNENFIVPPQTDFEYTGHNKLRHRYYYAFFPRVVKDYEQAVSDLNSAVHWSGNINFFDKTQTNRLFKNHLIKKFLSGASKYSLKSMDGKSRYYQSATLDSLHELYFIQFDFNAILETGKNTVTGNAGNHRVVKSATTEGMTAIPHYRLLAQQLLVEIANKEEGAATENYNWPRSISQSMLEKIFEMIPVQENSSLERFGLSKTEKYSLLLLNPKIKLAIDLAAQVNYPPNPSTAIMAWSNSVSTSFYRDTKGNIKQSPFLSLDPGVYPANKLITVSHDGGGQTNYYNIANNADLELVQITVNSPFIAVYQPLQRPNILTEKLNSDLQACIASAEHDFSSQLVFEKNPDEIFNYRNECTDGVPIFANVGIYSKRNLIQPQINILLNQQILSIPFGRTIAELVQTGYLTKNFELYRVYNGNLTKMKFDNSSAMQTLLLPMDHLTIK